MGGTAHLEADAKVHGVLPEFRALVVVVGARLRQVAVGAADATPAAEEGVRIVLFAAWLAVIGVWLEPRAENEPVLFDSDRPTSPSRGKSTLAPFTLPASIGAVAVGVTSESDSSPDSARAGAGPTTPPAAGTPPAVGAPPVTARRSADGIGRKPNVNIQGLLNKL